MRELTFFTSNQTKLAHARYVAEGWPLRIKGFRNRTYHADYEEPRLTTRTAILDASYASAKQQLAKAGYSESSHPFILEDTSVRIDALSCEDDEVPGVDIKYWMREQSFDRLDALLKSHGNNRSVTVRSDVLLHVPKNYKAAWGVEHDYIVFVGDQSGSIVSSELDYQPNLVFPWLDAKSFNKWFQPDGCEGPLGSLPIEVADIVDFRRKSFTKLFEFLKGNRFLPSPAPSQMQLPLQDIHNVILCGYTCAGKTTASQHLARKFGFLHIEASDFMHLSYLNRHGFKGPISIGDFAENALSQKPTIAAEQVVDYLLQNMDQAATISGFRSPAEVAHLQRQLEVQGKKFTIYFVEASEDNRFERMQRRARPGDTIDFEKFIDRDRQQMRMGLEDIRKRHDVLRLSNDSSLEAYLASIDRLVGDGHRDEIEVGKSFQRLREVREVGLEDAILVALLKVWDEDEAREFYTTKRIADLIAEVFPSVQPPKHKDNVSRYFNQDFYAFYEIDAENASSTRKYRLSNTGFGAAMQILRALLEGLQPGT